MAAINQHVHALLQYREQSIVHLINFHQQLSLWRSKYSSKCPVVSPSFFITNLYLHRFGLKPVRLQIHGVLMKEHSSGPVERIMKWTWSIFLTTISPYIPLERSDFFFLRSHFPWNVILQIFTSSAVNVWVAAIVCRFHNIRRITLVTVC